MNKNSVSLLMKVVAVSLVMVFSSSQLRAAGILSANGSVEQIWADRAGLVPGQSGGLWVTLSDNPVDWIYVTNHSLASAALGAFKTTGIPDIFISADPYRGEHKLTIMVASNNGPLFGSNWISAMWFLNNTSPEPFLIAEIVDDAGNREAVVLSTPEQAAIAAMSMSTAENISYSTTCAWFYNSLIRQVEEFCNAADWIAIEN